MEELITREEFKSSLKRLRRQISESFINHGQGKRTANPRYFKKVDEFKELIDQCKETSWFEMPTKGMIYELYNQK